MKRSIIREIIFYAVIIVLIVVALAALFSRPATKKLTYGDVVKYIENGQVREFTVSSRYVLKLTVEEDGKEATYSIRLGEYYALLLNNYADKLQAQYELPESDPGRLRVYDLQVPSNNMAWLSYVPMILLIVALVVVWIFSFRSLSGKGGKFNSFGRAKTKTAASNDKDKVLFRDVAGADEEKEELVEIVEFLKDPQKFTKLGARIPHGVLLVGPPGTGKTLLAKAVAGEAGVPFYSISGSDFVEMYVGVGASRVRDLFENARRSPAAIIFIDEIDAVGRHRGAGLGGGHDEREQTLNQLLVEMDGFGSHEGIIVMAATNRPDILDPALLRPGRFDRQVTVNYPDIKGREAILHVHARKKPMEAGVDFHKVAQSTVGFTGADLANLLNEAALRAAKRNKSLIGMEDIEASYMKMLLGPQKKTKARTEKDNKLVAYHEAGHAVVTYYCEHTDPVKHITIIPAGRAGGVTIRVPQEDQLGSTRGEMLDDIRISLGGRIAEELIMEDISTGASSDIQQATRVARDMVTRYGMSAKLGTVLYGNEHSADEVFLGRDFSSGKNYSEKTAAEIDDEIRAIIENAYKEAKAILEAHIDKLHFVAQYLLGHESMDGDQFAAAMKDGATVEEIEKIAAEKEEQSRRDNEARAKAEAEAAAKRAAGEGGLPPLDQLLKDIAAEEQTAREGDPDAGPDGATDGAPDSATDSATDSADGTPEDNAESGDADSGSDESTKENPNDDPKGTPKGNDGE